MRIIYINFLVLVVQIVANCVVVACCACVLLFVPVVCGPVLLVVSFKYLLNKLLADLCKLDPGNAVQKRKGPDDPDFTLLRTVWIENHYIVYPPLHELKAEGLLEYTYLARLPSELLLLVAYFEVDPLQGIPFNHCAYRRRL